MDTTTKTEHIAVPTAQCCGPWAPAASGAVRTRAKRPGRRGGPAYKRSDGPPLPGSSPFNGLLKTPRRPPSKRRLQGQSAPRHEKGL